MLPFKFNKTQQYFHSPFLLLLVILQQKTVCVAFSPPPHPMPVKSKLDKHCTAEVTYLNGIQTNQFLFMFLIWECSLLIHYTLETHQGHKWSQVTGRQGQGALIITLRQLEKAAAEGTLHPSASYKWTFQGLVRFFFFFFFPFSIHFMNETSGCTKSIHIKAVLTGLGLSGSIGLG